jgi:prophage antirepressor-like protein
MNEQNNGLQVFNNSDFGQVRTITIDNEIWFVAKDVCDSLDIQNARDAVKRLDDDEVSRFNLGSLSGEVNIVSEAGLYSLVLGSRKKEAKAFKRWITHEVIPAIRKTGSYSTKPLTQLEILQGSIELLAQQDKRIERLENKVETALARPVLEDWRSWANDTINSIVARKGLHYQTFRHELYEELEAIARCNLTARVNRLKERMKKAGHKYKDREAITKIHVIEDDPKLKVIFEGIIKRESAREAVSIWQQKNS